MTHGSSPKKTVSIPDKYSPDFAERLDGRTSIAKAILGRIETIETDLGGADGLSHARRSLVRRAVWLEAIIEHTEQRLALGESIDLGGHTQAINSLLGLYRLLGMDRRPRAVKTLRDVMSEGSPADAPEAEEPAATVSDADTAGETSAAPTPPESAREAAASQSLSTEHA